MRRAAHSSRTHGQPGLGMPAAAQLQTRRDGALAQSAHSEKLGESGVTSRTELSGIPASSSRAHPLDEVLLQNLLEAFKHHAGVDSRIDVAELQKSLEIRNEYLARRMLRVFDTNGDGVVSREEFLEGVRRLVFGSVREKLKFAFRIHDLNDDQVIERKELLEMITLSMAEENAACSLRDAERLTDLVMKAADRSGDGRVTYREFEQVMFQHKEVLELITRSEAQWIAPNEDLFSHLTPQVSRLERVRRYLDNHLSQVLLFAIWAGINAALFSNAFASYASSGPFVQLARACGACLNLNGALIFVPVMRRLLTRARRTPGLRELPIDDALGMHRFLGSAVVGLGIVHSAAHIANKAQSGAVFGAWLSGFYPATGLALLVLLLVMWLGSRPKVRSSGRFELFYVTHLGYVAFAGLALLHGRNFFLWATLPLVGLAVEQLVRAVRRAKQTQIVSLQALRSGVTRLKIQRPEGFQHRAGDYIFIRIPQIARFEWHPFTISSAPEAEHLTLHVRSLGDFTGALRKLTEERHARGDDSPLTVFVDGPYGTASGDIFASKHAVLIGAGIGVTPFASVLESLVLRAERGDVPLQKAHFYWLNRDPYSFEWFGGLLLKLEQIDQRCTVNMHICMTGGRGNVTATALNLAREVSHALGNPDLVTGLCTKTRVGAPDWEQELRAIRDQHAPEPVDVFFCGPPGLARKLRSVCSELGLRFRQEHF